MSKKEQVLVTCEQKTWLSQKRTQNLLWKDAKWAIAPKHFLPLASHTMHLYLCFATQMALLGFFIEIFFWSDKFISMAFPWFLSLTFPAISIHAGACDNRHCVCVRERERVHIVEKMGAHFLNRKKFLVLSRVWTLANCVAGECRIHYTMPLEQTRFT